MESRSWYEMNKELQRLAELNPPTFATPYPGVPNRKERRKLAALDRKNKTKKEPA